MNIQLGVVETKFADLIWSNEPLPSSRLVQLCKETLGWKKSTTYTVLRRLCEKGLFQNKDGVVTSLLPRETVHADQCQQFVDSSFDGSLPAFLAAYLQSRPLSQEDVDQIQTMIDTYRKEAGQ